MDALFTQGAAKGTDAEAANALRGSLPRGFAWPLKPRAEQRSASWSRETSLYWIV